MSNLHASNACHAWADSMSLRQLSQNVTSSWSNESVPFSPGAQSHWFKINSHPRIDKEFSPLANKFTKTVRVCVWPGVLLWRFECSRHCCVADLWVLLILCGIWLRFAFFSVPFLLLLLFLHLVLSFLLLLFLYYVFRPGVSAVLCLVTCGCLVVLWLGFVMNVLFVIPFLSWVFSFYWYCFYQSCNVVFLLFSYCLFALVASVDFGSYLLVTLRLSLCMDH